MKPLLVIWAVVLYIVIWILIAMIVCDAAQRHWALSVFFAWLFGVPMITCPVIIYREIKR